MSLAASKSNGMSLSDYVRPALEHCMFEENAKTILTKLLDEDEAIPETYWAFVEHVKNNHNVFDLRIIDACWAQILLEASKNLGFRISWELPGASECCSLRPGSKISKDGSLDNVSLMTYLFSRKRRSIRSIRVRTSNEMGDVCLGTNVAIYIRAIVFRWKGTEWLWYTFVDR